MALNASGPISLGGSTTGESIALELGLSATAAISLNDTAVRTLLGIASGAIDMDTAHGKSDTIPISYLLIAGGGGGGAQTGGGGGGGGLLTGSANLAKNTTYSIVVGAGGAYGYQAGGTSWGYNGQNGYNSTFNGLTSYGGGGGISANGWPYNDYGNASNLGPNGLLTTNGGSGGGGGTSSRGYTATGTGVSGQGYSYTSVGIAPGGAGAGGTNPSSPSAGNGGPGAYSSISGSSTAYAGGGGGGGTNFSGTQYPGGVGGGGTGNTRTGAPGTTNTGGGGGGGGQSGSGGLYQGGNGGSGICIISFLSSVPTPSTVGSPTITTSGSYKIYTFTGSGSIKFDGLGIDTPGTNYRYVKWTITAIRSSGDGVQASEFCLQNSGVDITGMSSATVTSSGSVTGGEEPPNLVDNDTGTKWYTSTTPTVSVTFDLGSNKTFNGYRWSTANDSTSRDPISWTVSGSNDGSTYTTLHTVTSASITTNRETAAGTWSF